jgi:chemotaxis protein CheD
MAQVLRPVLIGELVVSDNPDDVLVAYGLGSCVGICLYDSIVRVGGLLHALLPIDRTGVCAQIDQPAKFVDQGVPLLVEQLVGLGAKRFRLTACLCGGANMLANTSLNGRVNPIGQLNVQAAKIALQSARVKLRADTTGGKAGRTLKLHVADGLVTVRTLKEGEYVLET